MGPDDDGHATYCAINQGLDGAYYVTANGREAVMIRKFKRLSPAWKRRVWLLLDSILDDTPPKSNVVELPPRRASYRPAASVKP